jgi:hypothetical protein
VAFFLIVAELGFARDDSIVDFCVDRSRNGYVIRGLDGRNLQALG